MIDYVKLTDNILKPLIQMYKGQMTLEWCRFVPTFLNNYRVRAIGRRVFLYTGFLYEEIIQDQLFNEINALVNTITLKPSEQYNTKKAKEIWDQLINAGWFEPDESRCYVAFQNGVYFYNDPAQGTRFISKDHESFDFEGLNLFSHLSVNYEEFKECPCFCRLLEAIVPEAIDRLMIGRFFAYTLFPIANNQRFHMVWWGMGNNGKSQLAEHWGLLLNGMTGYVGLNALLTDSHAPVGLRFKNLNVCGEISGIMMNQASLDKAKQLMTDHWLPGRDIYESQSRSQYRNTCRHIISTNELPYSEYMLNDLAFFSRFYLIHFPVHWDKVAPLFPDMDPKHVFDEIFEKEGAQIVAWVLQFVPEINKLEIDAEQSKEKWLTAGNSAVAFLHAPQITNDIDTPKRELYAQFKTWCMRNHRGFLTYQTFFQILKRRGYTEKSRWEYDIDTQTKNIVYYIEALGFDETKVQKTIEESILDKLKGES